MIEFFKIALKNFRKRKTRAFLTLVGILISVATIVILISISLGLEQAVTEQFRLLGTDKFFVQPRGQLAGPGSGGAVFLTEKDLDTIKKVQGIKEVSPWIATSSKVEHSGQIRYTISLGMELETSDLFMENGAYVAQEGRVLREGDSNSIMIGSQYKDNNFMGKPVKVGDRLEINGQEFRVKGILETVGSPHDDRLIYMPIEDFRTLFNLPNRIDTIVVQVDNEANLKSISERVKKRLTKARGLTEDTRDFTILTPEELLESFGAVLNIITGFLLGIAAISLLVGGIGIANTMYTSVLERTKEIGVMKAIGAQNKDILSIFLIESGMLGLAGGIIGVSLGYVISKSIEYIAITQLGTNLLRVVFPTYLVIGSLLFAFIIGAVSGLWPAWKATKVKPVDALRYE